MNELVGFEEGQQLALTLAKAFGLPGHLAELHIEFKPDSLPIVRASFFLGTAGAEALREQTAEFCLVPKTSEET